jgi:hypothetical protein
MANSGTLNRRILDDIDKANASEEVRDLLKWALGFELEQAWENNPQFRKEYERAIVAATRNIRRR